MKFQSAILPSLLALLLQFRGVVSTDEQEDGLAVINNIQVVKYSIDSVLQKMNRPKETASNDSNFSIPSHLQYIVGLDQAGNVVKGTGIKLVDPEYAGTLSDGDYTTLKKKVGFFKTTTVHEQRINRCYGGGWSMLDIEAGKYGDKDLSNSGEGFLEKISNSDEDCILVFQWNSDFTKATILGYFDSLVGDVGGKLVDSGLKVTIELQPYWQWKFGLKVSKTAESSAKKLDSKCCPGECLGADVFGSGGNCDTISACGEVAKEHMESCAMYKRRNLLFAQAIGLELPFGMGGYLVFPLADKNGLETPYNRHYFDAVKTNGVKTCFHGVQRQTGANDGSEERSEL